MSYCLLITRYLDRPWSEEDRKESYQGSIQDVHSMADVTAILMQNSVTMREGLYFKATTFKNKATENMLLRSLHLAQKCLVQCFLGLHSSSLVQKNLKDAKETQHLKHLKQKD